MEKQRKLIIDPGYDLVRCSLSVLASLSDQMDYYDPIGYFYFRIEPVVYIVCKRKVSKRYFDRLKRQYHGCF